MLYNQTNANSRITDLNNRFDDCYRKRLQDDSVRVVNNAGKFGCLSFTLMWNSSDDLDLSIIDANNDFIYFKKYCKNYDNNFSSAGGQLDIDLNADNYVVEQPIENVYFNCTPPKGIYIAQIRAYEKRESRPVSIKLIIREKGKIIKELFSTISRQDELVEMIKYNYHEN